MTTPAELQLDAFEARVAGISSEIGECVTELVDPRELPRFVIAERLLPLGSALLPHLRPLMEDPASDADLRGEAAYLGFMVGDRETSAVVLLDQLRTDGPLAMMAAEALSKIRYPGVLEAVEAALERTSPSSIDEIVVLLFALSRSGGTPDDDVRRSLESDGHWQVTSALDELFPETH